MARGVIVVVDPDPGFRSQVRSVLAGSGLDVISAESNEIALRKADGRVIYAFILDIAQARLDELVRCAQAANRRVGFILTVPVGQKTEIEDALEAARWHDLIEIRAVLEKPLFRDDLLAAVTVRGQSVTVPDMVRRGKRRDLVPVEAELEDEPTLVEDVSELMPKLRASDNQPTRPLLVVDEAPPPAGMQATLLAERILSFIPKQIRAAVSPSLGWMSHACELALADKEINDLVGGGAGADSSSAREAAGPKPAISGDIERMPLDQMLQVAGSVGSPSMLCLEEGSRHIEIFFKDGFIVFARQSNLREDFLIGRFIADTGAISQHEVEAHVRSPAGSLTRLGAHLKALGVIDSEHLSQALNRQTSEIVFEALRWTSGKFSIFPKVRLPSEAEDADMCFPVQHLLLEGVRRLDEWKRMTGTFVN